MDYTLEVIVIPVSDVDRSKAFYQDQCGFNVDVDHAVGNAFRVVQLTPPGSACSITIGIGLSNGQPGSVQGIQLCVADIEAARAELLARGLDVSPIRNFEDGEWREGRGGPWNSFMFFSDPDGNGWTIQEKPSPEQIASASTEPTAT
jgi:catechol 2,3-dioxygenase-like lactoylglutathione lyase family enzyme